MIERNLLAYFSFFKKVKSDQSQGTKSGLGPR